MSHKPNCRPLVSTTACAAAESLHQVLYERLPGLHLRYALQKNWVWRASWTNTLGRPNYPDLAAPVRSLLRECAGTVFTRVMLPPATPT
jgi:hypothetical protein